jgi:hypothetical protein
MTVYMLCMREGHAETDHRQTLKSPAGGVKDANLKQRYTELGAEAGPGQCYTGGVASAPQSRN